MRQPLRPAPIFLGVRVTDHMQSGVDGGVKSDEMRKDSAGKIGGVGRNLAEDADRLQRRNVL